MLPDFLKAKELVRDKLLDFFDKRVSEHSNGLIPNIPRRPLHEGAGFITKYLDGVQQDTTMRPIKSSFELKIEEIVENPALIFERINAMAIDVAVQQATMVTDSISEVTEKIGNVVRSAGEVTPNEIFEIFEKIEIDFNSDGTARMPTIYGGDKMLAGLSKAFDLIKSDPKLEQRFTDIMNKKKDEWNARENNRELVG